MVIRNDVTTKRPRRTAHVDASAPTTPTTTTSAPTTTKPTTTPALPPKTQSAASIAQIDHRVPVALHPIQHALGAHWQFLYRRADPELAAGEGAAVAFTKKRTDVNAHGVQAAIDMLDAKGIDLRKEKAIVFGGGYEVDLAPLLERFGEVHVVDLCPDPLALAARKYADHPHRDRLKLVCADASGIPAGYQQKELARVQGEVARDGAPSKEGLQQYFDRMPAVLERLPFETGAYACVVSPVLHESLPFGTAVAGFEQARAQASERQGTPVARKAIDDHLGEGFYYGAGVRDATTRIFHHNNQELQRMTKPGGACVFTSWMREDEHQSTYAPAEQPLRRVGDSRMTLADWESMFDGWAERQPLHREQIYGPDKKPTLNLFLLRRDDEKWQEPGTAARTFALRFSS